MTPENMVKLKYMVSGGNRVRFVKYVAGELWYSVDDSEDVVTGMLFEFPVPISDAGTATFLAEDKALLFMRYIRQHLNMLEQAKHEKIISDEALTAAFARGTAKAVEESHAAGMPVHAMQDGQIVVIPDPKKEETKKVEVIKF